MSSKRFAQKIRDPNAIIPSRHEMVDKDVAETVEKQKMRAKSRPPGSTGLAAVDGEKAKLLAKRRTRSRLLNFRHMNDIEDKRFTKVFEALEAGCTDAQAELKSFLEWGVMGKHGPIWSEFLDRYLMCSSAPQVEYMLSMRRAALAELQEDRAITNVGIRYARATMPQAAEMMDREPPKEVAKETDEVGGNPINVIINNQYTPDGKPVPRGEVIDTDYEED